MKNWFKRLIVIVMSLLPLEAIANLNNLDVLVFDQKGEPVLPKQFRSSVPLHISGSAQFSEKNILEAAKSMQGLIWIIDLRRESHGFINGLPISWYFPQNRSNVGLTTEEIKAKELNMLEGLKKINPVVVQEIVEKSEGSILRSAKVNVVPHLIENEEALSKRLGFHYLRLPVADHNRPDDDIVDNFVEFMRKKPENSWLHFHCRGGKGRTTTFMTMYDMLMNAKKQPQNEIIQRQRTLGGKQSNLININQDKQNAWKQEAAIKRKLFIELFYQYASSEEGYPKVLWSEWLKTHGE